MTTSKSPRRVLQVAYEAACRALPPHRHKFSPKKFTQPQLLACLVLKEFARLDYRGLAAHLADHPDLCRQIGLKAVPHYTTFQKAAQRLLAAVPGRKMFDAVLQRALQDRVRSRRRGPASDLVQFGRAWSQAARRARIEVLLADADFDAEWLHHAVRSHGVRTIIPPARGRPSDKPPVGRWRRVMKQRFARPRPRYGQRWQVESVNSMIKRLLGSALRARRYDSQGREIILRAITHNVMIVRVWVFYRAPEIPFWGDLLRAAMVAGSREILACQKSLPGRRACPK